MNTTRSEAAAFPLNNHEAPKTSTIAVKLSVSPSDSRPKYLSATLDRKDVPTRLRKETVLRKLTRKHGAPCNLFFERQLLPCITVQLNIALLCRPKVRTTNWWMLNYMDR
ncbi:hypothetical protein ElyMa_001040500 [Elysia marginata]|uniref:Uncharacterized protein n=1 Tax=Elysia marginata TaxID=1093978 RepID=A0AAV4HN45_9GAST|nr:hypothetical protein ElyMa_001040500 [Elysia marginata]